MIKGIILTVHLAVAFFLWCCCRAAGKADSKAALLRTQQSARAADKRL